MGVAIAMTQGLPQETGGFGLGDRPRAKSSVTYRCAMATITVSNPMLEASTDYDRIAQAIAFMKQHHLSQPDLATVAQQVHLSEYHFQRLFTQP
jgi:AraC-like DNA-binding protein